MLEDKRQENPAEYPSPGKQRAMGELLFLAMRSGDYAQIPLYRFRDLLEPAIDHKQLQVFRFDDVPRGAVLWAQMSEQAEARFLKGDVLSHTDWNSGDRLWVAGLLAPYRGIVSFIVRWGRIEGNLPARRFNYLRLEEGSAEIRKVVSVDLDAPQGQRIKSMSIAEYMLLDQKATIEGCIDELLELNEIITDPDVIEANLKSIELGTVQLEQIARRMS